MKDEKVIGRTRTLSIWDANGQKILIKITLEMVNPITKELIRLPKETPELKSAMTKVAYETVIARAKERRNDSKASG